ncbi:MAG: alpha/beta hydrolase [Coriobacteriia bacterium]|nr:alpha/beta hydrolase [Coriobacteriia bacterium]
MPHPCDVILREVELPGTRLRYAECGDGPPLIIVPATVSLAEDWAPMIQFMGQRYHTHFFEMPGHGGSTPLAEGYSSTRLAQVIGDFADHLGAERFALMGFSFGGILALRALQQLGERVDKVGLLSPCVSSRALMRPPIDRALISAAVSALEHRLPRRALAWLLGNERAVRLVVWFMCDIGGFETPTDLRGRLMSYSASTLAVLVAQVREILTVTEEDLAGPYPQPCFFGMSEHDPLLDYVCTERFVRENFADLISERFDWSYHAPPVPPTFDDYVRDYGSLLDADAVRVSADSGRGI